MFEVMTENERIYIRIELKRRKITQTVIAKDLGVSSAYISAVLLGKEPCPDPLRALLLGYVEAERDPVSPIEPILNLIYQRLYQEDISQINFAAAMGISRKHMTGVLMGHTGASYELLVGMLDYVGYELAVAKK